MIFIPQMMMLEDASPIGALVSFCCGLILVIGVPIGVHVEYNKTLTRIESQEKMAISQLGESNIAAVEDLGSDGYGMREVSVLKQNGETLDFYYSTKTHKAITMQ